MIQVVASLFVNFFLGESQNREKTVSRQGGNLHGGNQQSPTLRGGMYINVNTEKNLFSSEMYRDKNFKL